MKTIVITDLGAALCLGVFCGIVGFQQPARALRCNRLSRHPVICKLLDRKIVGVVLPDDRISVNHDTL